MHAASNSIQYEEDYDYDPSAEEQPTPDNVHCARTPTPVTSNTGDATDVEHLHAAGFSTSELKERFPHYGARGKALPTQSFCPTSRYQPAPKLSATLLSQGSGGQILHKGTGVSLIDHSANA